MARKIVHKNHFWGGRFQRQRLLAVLDVICKRGNPAHVL